MRPFEDALPSMLYGALIGYATVREFEIEDEAARFFVGRAFDNIKKRETKYFQYASAVVAIINLPRFFDRLETHGQKHFLNEAAAVATVKAIQSERFGCIYPWCTDVPVP